MKLHGDVHIISRIRLNHLLSLQLLRQVRHFITLQTNVTLLVEIKDLTTQTIMEHGLICVKF